MPFCVARADKIVIESTKQGVFNHAVFRRFLSKTHRNRRRHGHHAARRGSSRGRFAGCLEHYQSGCGARGTRSLSCRGRRRDHLQHLWQYQAKAKARRLQARRACRSRRPPREGGDCSLRQGSLLCARRRPAGRVFRAPGRPYGRGSGGVFSRGDRSGRCRGRGLYPD
ncbi:hypothetical protein SDC9_161224 [bioreactor metagenome]|uniref:Uncharacterized protein n=1 Tax=bioreactor metagenome TaxID=1076179 RepID=A0A645FHM0_9ZZZZ